MRTQGQTHTNSNYPPLTNKVRGNPAVILDKYAVLHGMKQQQSD